jgi:hypothetical protein
VGPAEKRINKLYYRKMQIWEQSTCSSRAQPIHRVLVLLELDWMEEVEMNCPLTLYTLAMVAPYLGQLRNLRKLRISQIFVLACISPEQYEQLVATFTSQFSKLSCLQQLCVSRAYFLHGHLQQVLRWGWMGSFLQSRAKPAVCQPVEMSA